MKKLITFLACCIFAVVCYAQSVSYYHQILMPEGCKVTLSVAKQDTAYYIIASVKSDNLQFLKQPIMLLKNYDSEVIKLSGELLSNKTETSGVMVGNVFVPASEIISSAQFQISVEQFEIIKDGVAKIRMTTSPIVHEKTFKKDCFGKKLYQFYQKVKKIEDDF